MENHAMAISDHPDTDSIDVFGFWLYVMTDCILFGALFGTYLVLNIPGGPGPDLKDYVNLYDVLLETFFLLGSNFTFGLAVLSLYKNKLLNVQFWLIITFILGAGFIFLELR